MTKHALITWGGWDGHEPDKVAAQRPAKKAAGKATKKKSAKK